jgi:uncharacterized protein YjbK
MMRQGALDDRQQFFIAYIAQNEISWMTGEHIEVECKLGLDEATYEKIKTFFSNALPEPIRQKNTFFDTLEKSLLSAHWVFRLRIEGGKSFLTAKSKGTVKGSVHSRPEYECEIPTNLALELANGFDLSECDTLPCGKLRDALGDLSLVPYMSFENTRIPIPWESYLLELDRFEIKGSVYYELEAETDSTGITELENKLKRLFEANGWTFTPSPMSKYKRALKAFGIAF